MTNEDEIKFSSKNMLHVKQEVLYHLQTYLNELTFTAGAD